VTPHCKSNASFVGLDSFTDYSGRFAAQVCSVQTGRSLSAFALLFHRYSERRDLAGLVGVGNLEFSSAATDRAEVVFAGITDPEKLRQIVSTLQES